MCFRRKRGKERKVERTGIDLFWRGTNRRWMNKRMQKTSPEEIESQAKRTSLVCRIITST